MRLRKKVVFVLPVHWSASMGGSEYQSRCLMDRLVEDGRAELYYAAHLTDPQFLPRGYEILPVGKPADYFYYTLHRDTLPLLRVLKKVRPDVIYQRVGCAYTGIAAWYAVRAGCRMVWHIAHDSDVQPHRWKGGRWFLQAWVEKKYLEYGLRRSHDIIAQTENQSDYLSRHYGRSVSAVVPNFHPPAGERIDKSGPLKILWVANFKKWKNPELFIRLAGDLEKRAPAASCTMIGSPASSGRVQRALEKEIVKVGTLTYLGPRSLEEVNALLAESHIFVNTSSEEGFANTFIQAWMRKVPVVSLYCNFDNLFDRHRIGFHGGTYDGMLRRVLSLVENPALREEMGEEAQRYAAVAHSMKNADGVMEILYR